MSDKDFTTWMTAKEVMDALECSRNTVIRLADRGVITRRETIAHKRYLRADINKILEAEKQTA